MQCPPLPLGCGLAGVYLGSAVAGGGKVGPRRAGPQLAAARGPLSPCQQQGNACEKPLTVSALGSANPEALLLNQSVLLLCRFSRSLAAMLFLFSYVKIGEICGCLLTLRGLWIIKKQKL